MRIEIRLEGGFAYLPGLQRPVVIELASLPHDEAGQLRQLVTAARFFDLPDTIGTIAKGAADVQTTCITVNDDDGRCRTVKLLPGSAAGPLQELVRALRQQAAAARSQGLSGE